MFKALFFTFITAMNLLAVNAPAGDLPVYFTGKVTGELVSSVFSRENFEFSPGNITNCVRKDVPPYLSSFRCEVSDVLAKVAQAGGKSIEVKLGSLVVFYKFHKSGSFYEYNYTGTSDQGPVKLTLWHYVTTPEAIKGFITFSDLSLSVPIVAKPAPKP